MENLKPFVITKLNSWNYSQILFILPSSKLPKGFSFTNERSLGNFSQGRFIPGFQEKLKERVIQFSCLKGEES